MCAFFYSYYFNPFMPIRKEKFCCFFDFFSDYGQRTCRKGGNFAESTGRKAAKPAHKAQEPFEKARHKGADGEKIEDDAEQHSNIHENAEFSPPGVQGEQEHPCQKQQAKQAVQQTGGPDGAAQGPEKVVKQAHANPQQR